ncbi:MAG: efflux RND transporter periplasmic adaptor subunit [Cyanobacteria bacterium J06621_3]
MTYQNIDPNVNSSDDSVPSELTTSKDITFKEPVIEAEPQTWLGGSRGLLIGLVLGLGLAFLGGQIAARQATESGVVAPTEGEQVASATVTTARAQSAPISQTITTNGTVEAFDLLSVAPRASGLQIQSVNVREGDFVNAGQVLAVLDDSVLRSQIDQAEAQVVAARAQVAQAEAQVAQAEASLAASRENFNRYSSLFNQGAVSAEELTSRRTQVATEEQTVGAAIATVESAEATVRSRQADVARLNTQLDQTLVLAPSSGAIAEKDATVGDTASTSTPLFKIISGDQLELAVKVPQSQLAQINVGTSVQIRSTSDKDLQLQGSVRSIDPVVNEQTRQATVNVGLPGSDRLRPGMFLQAQIVTGSREGVVIPADAVLPQASGGFVVYVLNADRTVSVKRVDVGDRIPATADDPAKIEITAGLEANTPVVVEGASYLQNGDTVDVADSALEG